MSFQEAIDQDMLELRKNYVDRRFKESPMHEDNAAKRILDNLGHIACFVYAKKTLPPHYFDALKLLIGYVGQSQSEPKKPNSSGGFRHVYVQTEIFGNPSDTFETEEREALKEIHLFRSSILNGGIQFIERRYLNNIEEFKNAIAKINSFPPKGHKIEELTDNKGKPVKLHETIDFNVDHSIQAILKQTSLYDIKALEKFLFSIFKLYLREDSPARNLLLSYIKQIYLDLSGGAEKLHNRLIRGFNESFDESILPSAIPSANTLNQLIRSGHTFLVNTGIRIIALNKALVVSKDRAIQAWYDRFPLFKEDSKNVLYYRHGNKINKSPEYIAISLPNRQPIFSVKIRPPEQ